MRPLYANPPSRNENDLRQDVEQARARGDRQAVGEALTHLGAAYHAQGRLAEAAEAYRLSLLQRCGPDDLPAQGRILNNLGVVYAQQGLLEQAEESYLRSLSIKRRLQDRLGEGQTLQNLALLRAAQGDVTEALRLQRQAVGLMDEAGAEPSRRAAQTLLARWEQSSNRFAS
jgi:tetratricopeptide (TPR) repeat protein